ncbi:MAG: hypothetical protein IJW57_01240 [Spirochaetaceae bacterium]|nr:hypothetical protein [Spirochaetaceae bacterium]
MLRQHMRQNLGYFFVVFYWCILLILHNSPLSSIIKASQKTQFLFLGMLFFWGIGYYLALIIIPKKNNKVSCRPSFSKIQNQFIFFILFFILLVLSLIGLKSGVFNMSYGDYFLRMRGAEAEALTGNSLIDFGIKLFIYPMLLSCLFICIYYTRVNLINIILIFFSILFYSYLTQTNYATIAAMYIVGVYFISNYNIFNFKYVMVILTPLLIVLIFAATTRYGKFNFVGMFKYYFVDYYTLGFYMFEVKIDGLADAGMNYTLGRSVLGPIELYIYQFLKILGWGHVFFPAYTENIDYNAIFIPAKIDGRLSNAFGTIAYTFFRDFSYSGVLFGGFLGGLLLGIMKRKESTFAKLMYVYILFIFLKGNSVSPFEQAYIYITPLLIYIFTFCDKDIYRIFKYKTTGVSDEH